MRVILLVLLIWLLIWAIPDSKEITYTDYQTLIPIETQICIEEKPMDPMTNLTDYSFIQALIYVESRGNDSIVGDGGKAIGCLQIWPIMVRQVNYDAKVLGIDEEFTYNDRYDRVKSIRMFEIWKMRHHPESSYETMARCWNGGFSHRYNQNTLKYWKKVKARLEETV